VRTSLARLLGLESVQELRLALECDDAALLTRVTLGSDSVLLTAHTAVSREREAGQLQALDLRGLPLLQAESGVVTLRGRTPSPMAELVMGRLPAML
jgi:hypothetical protein